MKPRERYPVDCFRKQFTPRQVAKARLYITACGLYEARLNGARAGQRLFLQFGALLDDQGEFTQKNIQCSNKKPPATAGDLHLQGG